MAARFPTRERSRAFTARFLIRTAEPKIVVALTLLVTAAGVAAAQAQPPAAAQNLRPAPSQTDADHYTRYELLAPETGAFRIIYDVTATTAGARYYWNGVRRGSDVSAIGAIELASGAPLEWQLVDAKTARENGFTEASEDGRYIQIKLARPVARDGEARLRILKTYEDAKSYFAEGERIVFDRSLGIPRNSVVLPAGYELIGVNYPSQVRTLADGRVAVSFMNHGTAGVPYRVTGRKLAASLASGQAREVAGVDTGARVRSATTPARTGAPATQGRQDAGGTNGARANFTFSERAFQDREIVYYLLAPETHSFRLYHDYTETREGIDRYLNVVRAGSKASDPSATNLDTGEALKVETLSGKEAFARGVRRNTGEDPFADDSELLVIWFPAVKKGQTARLRIWETYTDANRYLLSGSGENAELIWDRAFGRPQNAVVLPAGWRVTANSIPATVSLTDDGRVRLDYLNDRPDNIEVFLRARRR